MAVVPLELVDQLKTTTKPLETPPTVKSAHNIDDQLSSIMQRRDLSDYDKALFYQDTLQKYLTYHGKAKKPLQIGLEKQSEEDFASHVEDKDVDTLEKHAVQDHFNIVQQIPTSYRPRANQILEHILKFPQVISWNDQQELIFQEQTVPGSNIVDLVYDTLRSRGKGFKPTGWKEYFSGLARSNIPEYLISNTERRTMVQELKTKKTRVDVSVESSSPKKKRTKQSKKQTSIPWYVM